LINRRFWIDDVLSGATLAEGGQIVGQVESSGIG
jgi:hypothetical protein